MSACQLPTPVNLVHTEFRFDTPHDDGEYRIVGILPDGAIVVAVKGADGKATTEFAFGLDQAAFIAQRIIAGDMGAARFPGVSRMLAAALITCFKAGVAAGAIERRDLPGMFAPPLSSSQGSSLAVTPDEEEGEA